MRLPLKPIEIIRRLVSNYILWEISVANLGRLQKRVLKNKMFVGKQTCHRRSTFQVQERYMTLSNNCIIRLLPRMRLSFLICENCLFGNFFYATRNDDRDKNTKIADDIDKTVTDANH